MDNLFESGDFLELVIKHMARDPKVLEQARAYKVVADDFGGVDVYRSFVNIIMSVDSAPMSQSLFLLKIKEAYNSGELNKSQEKTILEFLFWIYNDEPLDSAYILEKLPEMLKHRRFSSLLKNTDNNPDQLAAGLNDLMFDLREAEGGEDVFSFQPFMVPVYKTKREAFGTGFPSIDAVVVGLAPQELGMIIGYSGTGKTAVAVHSAAQSVLNGIKVLYLSIEEPGADIAQRFYANYFKISYTDLHHQKGSAQAELQSKMSDLTEEEKAIMSNLRIEDLRNMRPLNSKYIAKYLDNLYAKTGYHPDVIYIDQMDYIEPNSDDGTSAPWEKYAKVAFEIDEFCNHLIGGEHKFAVWLLHQATGKMRRHFSNAEISGFKGIIKPADIVIGIGKDKPEDTNVSIFSLKCRHTKNFTQDFLADLNYMRFQEMNKGGQARMEQEKELIQHGAKASKFNNLPAKKKLDQLLPPADGRFT
jgi:hypothetical protein